MPYYRFILASVLAFCFSAFCYRSSAQSPFLDSVLTEYATISGGTGFAVAVVKKDSLLYANAFGFRDLGNRLPVTVNTVFPIGSCTKAFTAALTGALKEKISLDKPVRTYIPELKFYNTEMTEQITVRDLLSHRTGLPRHDYSWFFLATENRDSMLKRVAFLEPVARIAEKWEYNNFGYFLAGLVCERVMNLSYEQGINRYILKPLQMQRTYFEFDRLRTDTNVAIGYRNSNGEARALAYHPLIAMSPAGGLNSNVLDMSRWLSAWISRKNILPADFYSQAITSQIVTKAALPEKQSGTYFSTYGLGWFLSSYRGHYRVEHGGNIDGFTSTASFFPADSIGIVVLSNRNASVLPALVRNLLSDHFLDLIPSDRSEEMERLRMKKRNTSVDTTRFSMTAPMAHRMSSYTGSYQHPGYGSFKIISRNDSLFARFGNFTWWLAPQQYNSFRGIEMMANGRPDLNDTRLLVQFQSNVNGVIEKISIPFEPAVPPIVFVKEFFALQVNPRIYTGRYWIDEEEGTISVNEAGSLSLNLAGQKSIELIPREDDIFNLKGYKEYDLIFSRDKKKQVIGFTLHQSDANFKATKL